MNTNWLKPIGTVELPWPNIPYDDRGYVNFRGNRPRQIHPGDRMVLYAVGGWKCIFGLVEVTGEVEDSGEDEWRYLVKVRIITNMCPSDGVPINEVNTLQRDLLDSIRARHAYIKLSPEEFELAVTKLRQREAELRQVAVRK